MRYQHSHKIPAVLVKLLSASFSKIVNKGQITVLQPDRCFQPETFFIRDNGSVSMTIASLYNSITPLTGYHFHGNHTDKRSWIGMQSRALGTVICSRGGGWIVKGWHDATNHQNMHHGILIINVRRCIQKFSDSIYNEIYAYNNKHTLRSNAKCYDVKTL
jgi:hypothetical protein